MFTMKSEVVGHLYWVLILLRVLPKTIVKDGASKFQTFLMNFRKFHALFSTGLSQLG
jgi:hypothetical protein